MAKEIVARATIVLYDGTEQSFSWTSGGSQELKSAPLFSVERSGCNRGCIERMREGIGSMDAFVDLAREALHCTPYESTDRGVVFHDEDNH
jgi:hypothetical protein